MWQTKADRQNQVQQPPSFIMASATKTQKQKQINHREQEQQLSSDTECNAKPSAQNPLQRNQG